jgi:hypothetical protein
MGNSCLNEDQQMRAVVVDGRRQVDSNGKFHLRKRGRRTVHSTSCHSSSSFGDHLFEDMMI